VKENRIRSATGSGGKVVLVLCFVVMTLTASVYAQSAPSDAENIQRRIARARVMAAAHNLTAAAFELDAILKSATDEAARDVARIMLMGIYLEQADYARAQNLLEVTFKARVAQNESSVRSYFALVGQSINGARAHLERYRAFGIDITDKDLPAEAVNDLDHLRSLLEHIAEQAKEMSNEDGKNTDAIALLEDVANMRGSLARDKKERKHWQHESAEAREKLGSSEIRIASAHGVPGGLTAATGAMNPVNAGSTIASSPSQSSSTGTDASAVTPTAAPPTASDDTNASKTPSPADASGGTNTSGGVEPSSKPVDVGSLFEKATQKVSPTYPVVAKTQRITGVVRVYLVVDEKGLVSSIERTSGPVMLQQAATDAARRWKFRPTMVDGQPVRVTGFINFNFTL
jgi:TonB family protein